MKQSQYSSIQFVLLIASYLRAVHVVCKGLVPSLSECPYGYNCYLPAAVPGVAASVPECIRNMS